jgi:hypothetical protein
MHRAGCRGVQQLIVDGGGRQLVFADIGRQLSGISQR